MNLLILVNVLQNAGIGYPGESLFQHRMPADCQSGVLLRLPLTGVAINHELPAYLCTAIQAIVRAPSQAEGDELAARVIEALTITKRRGLVNPATGQEGLWVNHMRPRHKPIVYPRSEANDLEWSINFDLNCVER